MEPSVVKIPESFVSIFGKDAEKVMLEIIKKSEKKLEIVKKLSDMNLPVAEWEEMEKEIIAGAIE